MFKFFVNLLNKGVNKIQGLLSGFSSSKRDAIGDILYMLLACIINFMAMPILFYIEHKQANEGGFPVEVEDIERRSFLICMVSVLMIALFFAW